MSSTPSRKPKHIRNSSTKAGNKVYLRPITYRGASWDRYMFDAMAWNRPIHPHVYNAKSGSRGTYLRQSSQYQYVKPSLHHVYTDQKDCFQACNNTLWDHILGNAIRKHDSPCDDPREGGVASANTEERPKILHSNRCLGDVDREADQTHHEAGQNEWWTLLNAIRPDCEDNQDDGWTIAISL